MLQFNQLADIELHFGPELTAVWEKISHDYAARRAVAPASDDVEVGLPAKFPSCSPVDVSHRSSLINKRLGAAETRSRAANTRAGSELPNLGMRGGTGVSSSWPSDVEARHQGKS